MRLMRKDKTHKHSLELTIYLNWIAYAYKVSTKLENI